jgi:thiamine biosynthesis protein ThiS
MPAVTIRLNGEPFDLPHALSVAALLARLDVDPKRVAVEVNESVIKRAAFDGTTIADGDAVEIVNFVGGG